MKKSSLLIALFFPLFFSCTKDDSTISSENTPPTNYQINGITDFSIQRYQTNVGGPSSMATLSLDVKQVGSVQEKVSISLANVPSGINYYIKTASGVPNFSTAIDFYDTTSPTTAIAGNYPVKIICDGERTGKHSYTVNMTVNEVTQCVSAFKGAHSVASVCDIAGYKDTISLALNVANRIFFTNFDNAGADIFADYNCTLNTISIPAQTVVIGGVPVTIAGSGSKDANANTLVITYTKSTSTSPCSITISL